jgi:thiol-disulfide isomerase/thioredoxin
MIKKMMQPSGLDSDKRQPGRGKRQRAPGIALGCLLALLPGTGGGPVDAVASAAGVRKETSLAVPLSRDGQDRVGQPAPSWGPMTWLNSKALSLSELRGKVVLIRFWTDTCPFCEATAPALRQLDAEFAARGLMVIGMYHPKPPGTRRPVAAVEQAVRRWGWRFPVALDSDWNTLNAFWLSTGDRSATSASFIMDRHGLIRFVHPGPEFHPAGPPDHSRCRSDYQDVRRAVQALLAEK